MAARPIDYSQFEFDPSNLENNLNLAYTQRRNQVSIVVTQDPRKEGILSFFENTNYNNLYNTLRSADDVTAQTAPSTTSTSGPMTSAGSNVANPMANIGMGGGSGGY